jgi:antitoxin PrlF
MTGERRDRLVGLSHVVSIWALIMIGTEYLLPQGPSTEATYHFGSRRMGPVLICQSNQNIQKYSNRPSYIPPVEVVDMPRRTVGGAHGEDAACCRVESLVTVDERGQMVLPKTVRERAGIRAGDKLALTLHEKDGRVCCITLIRASELTSMVERVLGPVMGELGQGGGDR